MQEGTFDEECNYIAYDLSGERDAWLESFDGKPDCFAPRVHVRVPSELRPLEGLVPSRVQS